MKTKWSLTALVGLLFLEVPFYIDWVLRELETVADGLELVGIILLAIGVWQVGRLAGLNGKRMSTLLVVMATGLALLVTGGEMFVAQLTTGIFILEVAGTALLAGGLYLFLAAIKPSGRSEACSITAMLAAMEALWMESQFGIRSAFVWRWANILMGIATVMFIVFFWMYLSAAERKHDSHEAQLNVLDISP